MGRPGASQTVISTGSPVTRWTACRIVWIQRETSQQPLGFSGPPWGSPIASEGRWLTGLDALDDPVHVDGESCDGDREDLARPDASVEAPGVRAPGDEAAEAGGIALAPLVLSRRGAPSREQCVEGGGSLPCGRSR